MTGTTPRDGTALATQVVHAGSGAQVTDAPVVTPLVQSVNFIQAIGTEEGLRYPRYGNVPNAESLQRRLSVLEGAEAAVVTASGMGATVCALLALLRPGDHLIASKWLYGGVRRLLEEEFPNFGITSTLVDPTETREWRRRLRKETRGIFVEVPANPTCRVADLRPLSHMTQELGLALVVDATFASPVNLRALEVGADVVIHSATKYLNGHNDVLGGVVLGTASYVEEVRQKMMIWGQAPDPFACWLLERGLKTLDVRVQRQNANALRIARWCEERKEIARVHYPGLESHPDHKVAKATLSGFGGMMALELTGGAKHASRFLKRLKLIKHAPSLGGVETLVSEPRFTSHTHLTADQRAAIGIPDGFLRLSIGIEDADDLIADIGQGVK
jgi:cystathionine beta-lyase/cystathionine gamma-synthase